MANVEKLIAGAVSSWTSAMTTELDSLASGNAIRGSTAVDNSANLDLWAEFAFDGGGSITPTGSPYFALYLYPKNGDATTFGDNRFGSAAAGPPPSNYFAGFCGLPAAAGTQHGTFSMPGSPERTFVRMPFGIWIPVFHNGCGVTLSSSGNTVKYRTANLNLNA